MSDYYDDRHDDRRSYDKPQRYTTTRTRPRRNDDADFVEETTFIERGKGPPPKDLIRARDDSLESVQRDRPRAYDDYGRPPPRRDDRRRDRSYDDDSDDDYLPAAGGAAAGYAAGRGSRGRDNYARSERGGGRRDRDYSDDSRGSSRSRKSEKKKSGIEGALAGLGLGNLAGALTGRKDRSRSRSADSGRTTRSRPAGGKTQREWAQAGQAALLAGAIEAFRSRNGAGPWTGEKAKRIATAAVAAGGIDKLVDRDPDTKSKRHLVEAVVGGLAANRLANGPVRSGSVDSRGRSGSRGGRARSRSVFSRYRSKSRRRNSSADSGDDRGPSTTSKIKDVGAGVVLAGVAKQIYDRVRSKSRRRRSPSTGSDDSRYDDRRSRGPPGGGDGARDRDRSVGGPYSQSRGGPDEGAVVGRRGGGRQTDEQIENKNQRDGAGEKGKNDDSSDSLSSTDMENRRKKLRGKEFLTAGLATIATIHAAHGVYQSMEASDKRHKLVAEGEMSPEEARKKRSKAWLQDAAAVGIAALGIKGAYSEWKEMNEQRHSVRELEDRRKARQKRRERRMKEAQANGYGNGNGGGGGPPGQYGMSGGAGGYPPQAYGGQQGYR